MFLLIHKFAKHNYWTIQELHALLNMNKTLTCQLNKMECRHPTSPASLSPIHRHVTFGLVVTPNKKTGLCRPWSNTHPVDKCTHLPIKFSSFIVSLTQSRGRFNGRVNVMVCIIMSFISSSLYFFPPTNLQFHIYTVYSHSHILYVCTHAHIMDNCESFCFEFNINIKQSWTHTAGIWNWLKKEFCFHYFLLFLSPFLLTSALGNLRSSLKQDATSEKHTHTQTEVDLVCKRWSFFSPLFEFLPSSVKWIASWPDSDLVIVVFSPLCHVALNLSCSHTLHCSHYQSCERWIVQKHTTACSR